MKKLSTWIKLSYGLADTCFIWMVNFSNFYILVFFTEVVKLSPAAAGIILTAGRIIDTASVPFIGPMIESSRLKWGRYRGWIFIGSFFIAALNAALFADFTSFPQTVMMLLYTAAYAGFCIATNVSYIGYTSLNSTLTDDPAERVQLGTLRSQGNAVGRILGGYIYLPMIWFLGGTAASGELSSRGFFLSALLLGLLVIAGYGNLFSASKDYKDSGVSASAKVSVKDMFRQVITTRPLIMMLIADTCRVLTSLLIVAMFPYYFLYIVKDPSQTSKFLGTTAILSLTGATLTPFITKKLTKRQTYILGNLWLCVFLFLMYFNASNASLVFIFACIGYVGMAFSNVVNTSMYADITDYAHWKTGKNARGVIFSVYQLAIKIAAVFSTSVSAFGLYLIGFQQGTEPSAQTAAGIKIIAMFLPASLSLAGVIALIFYSINEKELPQIRKEISERASSE